MPTSEILCTSAVLSWGLVSALFYGAGRCPGRLGQLPSPFYLASVSCTVLRLWRKSRSSPPIWAILTGNTLGKFPLFCRHRDTSLGLEHSGLVGKFIGETGNTNVFSELSRCWVFFSGNTTMAFKRAVGAIAFLLIAAGSARAQVSAAATATATASASVAVSTYSVALTSMTISTYTWRTLPNHAFKPGEDLQFVVKWGLVVAGYSSLSVTDIDHVDGRAAYHITSKARSGGMVSAFYKVQDNNQVWMDVQSLLTLRYEKRIKEGKYQIEETTSLDQARHRWITKSFRVDKNSFEQKEGDLPPETLDSFGSLYYVRTLPLELGQTYTFDVHSGDKVYPLIVKVLKYETIKVPAGRFDCIKVEPALSGPGIFVNKGKKLEVWLTRDDRRMPVRMRSEIFIGHVSAELLPKTTDYTPAQ